jgi:hypothetical protein
MPLSSADQRIAAKNGKRRAGPSSNLFKPANLKNPRCSASKCRSGFVHADENEPGRCPNLMLWTAPPLGT